MKTKYHLLFLLTFSFVILLPRLASAANLGDSAVRLHIEQWVKGDPVNVLNDTDDTIYVVEFWATWCGPCRTSIPHLTELQKKYKDKVVLIGVTDEPMETVEPYVTESGKKMDYTVAIDTSGRTQKDYMTAYRQNGIPTAFIVDAQKRIAWYGHPMGDLDKTLSMIIDGTYDVEVQIRLMGVEQDIQDYYSLTKNGNTDAARALGLEIAEIAVGNASLLNQFAWMILTETEPENRDIELGMDVAQAAYEATDGTNASVTDTYARAFFESGKLTEAIHYQKLAVQHADDSRMRSLLEEVLVEYTEKAQNVN